MIKRIIIDKILYWIDKEKIIILKGSRQVGKTTILKYIKEILEQKNKKVIYISVDQEWDAEYLKNPNDFIEYLKIKFQFSKEEYTYIFLDEFQYIKKAGLFLKVIFDKFKKNVQLIVTGSSSLEISKNSEFLTGRKIEFIINPVSYKEYFIYKSNIANEVLNLNITELKRKYLILKQELNFHFNQYLKYGGYPEVVIKDKEQDKITIIKELISTYIQKDIISFLKIENIDGFNKLIKCLASQIGNLLNIHEIKNTIGLSNDTAKKYLTILNHTYIFYYIMPFFTNVRKELTKMKKIYIADFGLLNFLNNQFVFSDVNFYLGSNIENFIYLSLMEKVDIDQIKFYRTISKSEIDFIVLLKSGLVPIEVKFQNKIIKMPVAMENFQEKHKNKIYKKIMITKDYLDETKHGLFIPAVLFPLIELSNVIEA